MIASDKDVISVPYPLKNMDWDKGFEKIKQGQIKTVKDLKFKGFYKYPMKVEDEKNIKFTSARSDTGMGTGQ